MRSLDYLKTLNTAVTQAQRDIGKREQYPETLIALRMAQLQSTLIGGYHYHDNKPPAIRDGLLNFFAERLAGTRGGLLPSDFDSCKILLEDMAVTVRSLRACLQINRRDGNVEQDEGIRRYVFGYDELESGMRWTRPHKGPRWQESDFLRAMNRYDTNIACYGEYSGYLGHAMCHHHADHQITLTPPPMQGGTSQHTHPILMLHEFAATGGKKPDAAIAILNTLLNIKDYSTFRNIDYRRLVTTTRVLRIAGMA